MTEPRPIPAPSALGEAAFDERFRMARDRLVRVCTGLVGADAAEDVVQDAYLRAHGRWRQLRDEDLFEAWLTRIAINLCMSRHRQRRRLGEVMASLVARETAPNRDVGLRELIERLPPRERTLIVLQYGYGYSADEMARLTGLSPVNVRTIVFRARRHLADEVTR